MGNKGEAACVLSTLLWSTCALVTKPLPGRWCAPMICSLRRRYSMQFYCCCSGCPGGLPQNTADYHANCTESALQQAHYARGGGRWREREGWREVEIERKKEGEREREFCLLHVMKYQLSNANNGNSGNVPWPSSHSLSLCLRKVITSYRWWRIPHNMLARS